MFCTIAMHGDAPTVDWYVVARVTIDMLLDIALL